MQIGIRPSTWFTAAVAVAATRAAHVIASSWLSNIFTLFGPPASQIERNAFRADLRTAVFTLGCGALIGAAAALLACALHTETNDEYWRRQHRAALRRSTKQRLGL